MNSSPEMRRGSMFFNQIMRRDSKIWIGEDGERLQVVRRSQTVKRIMNALFIDAKRHVAQITLPERASVTGQFYAAKVLPVVVVKHYNNVYSHPGNRDIHLLHANAPVVLKEYIDTYGIQTLPHPPHSPVLAHLDLWLNPVIKTSQG